jgi:hypothetical protein
MTRPSRVLVVAALAALVATTAAAAPADPSGPRLEVGSWIAEAVIQGSAGADVPEGRFDLTARFDFRFELLVGTDGAATGSWDTDGVGTLIAQVGQTATLDQVYSGAGTVFTMGEDIVFDGSVTRTGTVTVNQFTQPVAAAEIVPEISVTVLGSTCEEAWGDIATFWNEQLETGGWTPAFGGSWMAVAQDVEPDERADLLPGAVQAVADWEAGLASLNSGDPGAVDTGGLWNLIDRTLPILNEIRNLGECAQRFFGPDGLEYWEHGLTFIVTNSIRAILMFQQPPPSGYEVLALVDAGLAAGSFGQQQFFPESGTETNDLLRIRAQEIFDGAVRAPGEAADTEGTPCESPSGCVWPSADEAAAILAGELMAWAFEVADGSLVPARQLADAFAEQTGPDGSFSDVVREAGP